jgi:hypothetical protein
VNDGYKVRGRQKEKEWGYIEAADEATDGGETSKGMCAGGKLSKKGASRDPCLAAFS